MAGALASSADAAGDTSSISAPNRQDRKLLEMLTETPIDATTNIELTPLLVRHSARKEGPSAKRNASACHDECQSRNNDEQSHRTGSQYWCLLHNAANNQLGRRQGFHHRPKYRRVASVNLQCVVSCLKGRDHIPPGRISEIAEYTAVHMPTRKNDAKISTVLNYGNRGGRAEKRGVPPSERGVPPSKRGLPPSKRGVPPSKRGVPPSKRGVPPSKRGVPPSKRGVPPSKRGVPPSKRGVPPSKRGVPPSKRGIPPSEGLYRARAQREAAL
ncbi:hypothetical protein DFR29_106243 [Tahibacter aquaticus]|uniref:Uncharacterized protein n=1 Tax=Tahibacter aquaticus TaxID=520092 RepID=A0A4R6YYQ0_9GAMM|nr:hypothetical protein DFR29_106243 [Tahibacter aquaticus]